MKVFYNTCPLCCGDVGLTWEADRGSVPVCTFCGTSLDSDASTMRRGLEQVAPWTTSPGAPRVGMKVELGRG